MIERVLLVAWKGSPASSWVDTLESGGYTVLLEETTGERAWRTAKERGIDCVIIDGGKKPAHGRQTGNALRDTAKTRNIPIIWANLNVEDVASVQHEVRPDVLLTAPTDAALALAAVHALATEHVGHSHEADAGDDEAGQTPAKPPRARAGASRKPKSTARKANATAKKKPAPKARPTRSRAKR